MFATDKACQRRTERPRETLEARAARREAYARRRAASGAVYALEGETYAPEHWQQAAADAMARAVASLTLSRRERRARRRAIAQFRACGTWTEAAACQVCGTVAYRVLASCGVRGCPWCARCTAGDTRRVLRTVLEHWAERAREAALDGDPDAGRRDVRMLTLTHPVQIADPASYTPAAIRARIDVLVRAMRELWRGVFRGPATGLYYTLETSFGGLTHAHALWWGYYVPCEPGSRASELARELVPGLEPWGFRANAFRRADGTPMPVAQRCNEAVKYVLQAPAYTAWGPGIAQFPSPSLVASLWLATSRVWMRRGYGALRAVNRRADELSRRELRECVSDGCSSTVFETHVVRTSDLARTPGTRAELHGVARAPYVSSARAPANNRSDP